MGKKKVLINILTSKASVALLLLLQILLRIRWSEVQQLFVNFPSCNIASSFVDMPPCDGMLNEHLVTVLRDTGCNGVVERRALLCDDQLTGIQKVCVLADGSRIQVPVARVKVDTPCECG